MLIVAEMAAQLSDDGYFEPADVSKLFETLRIPPPADASTALGQLARSGLTRRRAERPRWTVTPLGSDGARGLIGSIDRATVESLVERVPGSSFASARHSTLPYFLAPVTWLPGVERFLDAHPFERNVFCMTRFPAENEPLRQVIDAGRDALRAHGLELHLASDKVVEPEMLGNIAAYMWASMYGLAIFECRTQPLPNYNVAIEVGAMLMTGRRCALLKDTTVGNMPTDLVGQIYKSIDLSDPDAVVPVIHDWVARDLDLGACEQCPTVNR